jgi:putative oxidoreductase
MNIVNLEGYGTTLIRASLGSMFIAHGLLKLLVFTIAGTAGFLESQGYPAWVAAPLTYSEIIGGVLLIIGFQTRLVSLILVPVLFGALLVHIPAGWLFSSAGGGWEYPLFLLVASISLVLTGGGALSLSKKDVLADYLDKIAKK